MIRFPGILVIAFGLPLLVAACGDDDTPAATGAGNVAAKCAENLKTLTAANPKMKAIAGKEDKLCGCLVEKVKADTALKDEDRSAIYAAMQTMPNSDEAKAAQAKISSDGNKSVATAMQACSKELMAK